MTVKEQYNFWLEDEYFDEATKNELFVTGSKALRDATIPTLRKYINYVMPSIFPAAALRIGQDAVKAPLSLILLALCE